MKTVFLQRFQHAGPYDAGARVPRVAMTDYPTSPNTATDAPLKAAQPGSLRVVARRLVEDEHLSLAAAERAEQEAREAEVTLLRHVIDAGLVTARRATLSAAWGTACRSSTWMPCASQSAADGDYPKAPAQARRGPIGKAWPSAHRGGALPLHPAQLDDLQFATGLSIEQYSARWTSSCPSSKPTWPRARRA
ncbi:hypothetical protein DSL92_05380 [Billgrantia gudaonensis]|uniref:Type II secretion system protein GspE N-terminal domain-containing protein n=1 Tax=Billgrantia gudaonensis TaxID=376427 RepID=A0A3S0NHC1_9GAMM|nr:hypothetical protein DSL92_05380 [Halomonas gudaonensis]